MSNEEAIVEHTNVIRSLVRREKRPGAVAFDLGSGLGRVVRVLVEEGFRVYGCELDATRAQSARLSGTASVDVGNVLEWKPPGQADVVTCIELIEHLQPADQRRLLELIRSWLKPDGALVLSTPQRYSVVSIIELAYATLRRQRYSWWDDTHVSVLRHEQLIRLLRECDFEVHETVGYHLVPDLFAARIPALKRFQRRAHYGKLKNIAFDLIYLVRMAPP